MAKPVLREFSIASDTAMSTPKLQSQLSFFISWGIYTLFNALLLAYSLTITDRSIVSGFAIEGAKTKAIVAWAIAFVLNLRTFILTQPLGKLTNVILDRSLRAPNPQLFSQLVTILSFSLSFLWDIIFIGLIFGVFQFFSFPIFFFNFITFSFAILSTEICSIVLSSVFNNSLLLLSWNYIISSVGRSFLQDSELILEVPLSATFKSLGKGLLCLAIEIVRWLMIPMALLLCARWVPGVKVGSLFVAGTVAVLNELAILLSMNFFKPFIEMTFERSKSISSGLYALVLMFILPLLFSYWFFWLQLSDRWIQGFSLEGTWAYLACLLALSLGKYSFKEFYNGLLLRVGVPAFLLEMDDEIEE